MIKNEFELLAPAGSFEILKAVIEAGADAVYVGGSKFGARAYANNFTTEELLEAIDYVHLRKKKLYLTVNTLFKNDEIGNELYDYLLPLYERGLDAVIVQDFGVISFVRKNFPLLDVHTSTQMTITGVDGARLMKELGATRVVVAREMSLNEMSQIHAETGMELEAFVHGALCYSYSGQCLFSSMLGGRSGNRGRCAQPCRLPYSVLDEHKKEYLSDSYVLSLKDLCGLCDLDKLNQAGVYSLKIEGRMKQASYAAGVVSFYRKYIDIYLKSKTDSFSVSKTDQQLVADLGNRLGFTNQYYYQHNGKEMITFEKPNYAKSNGELHRDIEKRYTTNLEKIPIKGRIDLYVDAPAMLELSFGPYSSYVTGANVMKAKNQPMTEEDVEKRVRKTGDSPFVFDSLEVNVGEDVFIPNGAINQLRRDGINILLEEILKKYRRNASDSRCISFPETIESKKENYFSASIEKREQLQPVLFSDISRIYISTDCYEETSLIQEFAKDTKMATEMKKEVYLLLPYIFRESTRRKFERIVEDLKQISFDGFMVKTYEELYFVKQNFRNKKIVLDHNLYTFNNYAIKAFEEYEIEASTVPLELNRKEIRLRNNTKSEMIIYGHYPLMVTAGCVHRNTKVCDKNKTITYLKDRYKTLFPVKNLCNECYNVIYNSLPTNLVSSIDEISHMGVKGFRYMFTIESEKEVMNILNHSFFETNYTNGHYKRGIE